MGRRKYWPIYEAAAKHGLHIMSHAFGSYGNPITGAGWPSFYLEDHVGPAQAAQANVVSLITEGVFDHFPTLKFVSVENGFGWIPSLMWRMDSAWSLLKSEVPHLKRKPSEYFPDHVYLTTQPVEEPHTPQQFVEMMEHFGADGEQHRVRQRLPALGLRRSGLRPAEHPLGRDQGEDPLRERQATSTTCRVVRVPYGRPLSRARERSPEARWGRGPHGRHD